jgi:hypothetical protein
LLFSQKAQLPSFPNEVIQKIHYGKTSVAEQFNLLQKFRKIALENATSNGLKTKEQYEKKVLSHTFRIGDKVLLSNDFDTTKNPKLVPNWKGPGEFIDINDTNAKIKLKNKIKVLNVAKLKHFFKNIKKSEDTEGDANLHFNQHQNFNQNEDQALKDLGDIFNQAHSDGLITRAKEKLIKYKDAEQLALILLKNETENIDSLCEPSDNCTQCESEYTYFANKNSLQFQLCQLKLAEQCCKLWQLKLMKKEANKINSTEDRCHSTVPERFQKPLMKVAYKLLSRDETTFEELTPTEQQLWSSFETDQIYRLLTGEPDTVPEFRFNWYTGTGGDAKVKFIPDEAQPIQGKITSAARSRPSPEAKVKMPKASTSTRAVLPSSSSSSLMPSMTPSSPTASTLGTAPKVAPTKSTSGSSATPSKSPSPTAMPASAATTAKGSG